MLEDLECDIVSGLRLLEKLRHLEADAVVDAKQFLHAAKIIHFCGSDQSAGSQKAADKEPAGELGLTAGHFRQLVSEMARTKKVTSTFLILSAIRGARRILADQEERAKEAERQRIFRERNALTPDPKQLDMILRHDAQIDRIYARAFGQLETLQRIQAGEHVEPPVRVEVNLN